MPERLIQALDQVLSRRVALISAPAGYGKTTVLRAWLTRHEELPQTLLTLEDVTQADVDQVTAWLAETPHTAQIPAVIAIDLKRLPSETTALQSLVSIAESDPTVRLIVAARGRPEIPFGRLAVRGQLLDLDMRELELTRAEVRDYLMPQHPELTEDGLTGLYHVLSGWPLLIALVDQEPISWGQAPRMLMHLNAHMAGEVLDQASDDDVWLLTQLATLRDLDQPSIAYLSGRSDAAGQLLRLANRGIPIKWDSQNAIGLNPALREYLLRQLGSADVDELSELQRKTVLWLRQRGRVVDAILHAADHGETELALTLFTDYSLTLLFTAPQELRPLIDQLETRIGKHWRISMAQAAVWASLEPGAVHPGTIEAVRAELPTHLSLAEQALIGGFTLALARQVGYHGIDISTACQIAQHISPETAGQAVTAVVLVEYGLVLLHQGNAAEAQSVLFRAVASCRISNMHWAAMLAVGALAYTHADHGDTSGTSRLADEAHTLAEEYGLQWSATLEYAELALALNAMDRGDYTGARRYIEIARNRDYKMRENQALWAYTEATAALGEGSPTQAIQIITRTRTLLVGVLNPHDEWVLAAAAFNADLALKRLDDAQVELNLLVKLEEAATEQERRGDLGDSLVFTARLLMARGEWQAAFEVLEEAAEHGMFNETAGKHTLHLLMTYGVVADAIGRTDLALDSFQRAGALADRLGLGQPGARHTTIATSFRSDPNLTDAELKVLKSLTSTSTLPETAEALFISINTLKTHLRRIYKKLGVANREEAIDWARLMGLIS